MKLWKLAILLMLVASFAACKVHKDSGLELKAMVSCEQEDTPTEGQAFDQQFGGVYDVLVDQFNGGSGYVVSPLIANTLETTVNEDFMQGEGNTIYLKRLAVDFRVPDGWSPIPSVSVPLSGTLSPGDRIMGPLNIIDSNVRKAINDNFAMNAYGELHDALTALPPEYNLLKNPMTNDERPYCTTANNAQVCPPPVADHPCVDVNGHRITNPDETGWCGQKIADVACTNANAEEVCNGYRCIIDNGSIDPDARGVCDRGCTAFTGCALKCYESTGVCTPWFFTDDQNYFCDIAAGDKGVCRQVCTTDVDCDPITDANGNVVSDMLCQSGRCMPPLADANPYDPVSVGVSMKVAAKNTAGDTIYSNVLYYDLTMCRGCQLNFGVGECGCSPVEYSINGTVQNGNAQSCFEDRFDINNLSEQCAANLFSQDLPSIACAWLPDCGRNICFDYFLYIASLQSPAE